MWSVNIEPFLRWWRLRGPGVRRHHRGAMKEWQWCTQTVHSALWEKKGKQLHVIPMAFYLMIVVLQLRISSYRYFVCLFVFRVCCNVQFRLSPDQYQAVAGLGRGSEDVYTVPCHQSPGLPVATPHHCQYCHLPPRPVHSLPQSGSDGQAWRAGAVTRLSRVTSHAVTWRHTVTAARPSRGTSSEYVKVRTVSPDVRMLIRGWDGSDVITNVTKLATNGYKRCNSIN